MLCRLVNALELGGRWCPMFRCDRESDKGVFLQQRNLDPEWPNVWQRVNYLHVLSRNKMAWHESTFLIEYRSVFPPLFPPPWTAFLILPRNITGGEEYGCLHVNTFSPTFPRPISVRTGSMEDKSEESKAEVSPECLRGWNKWEMRVCLGDVTNCLRGGGGGVSVLLSAPGDHNYHCWHNLRPLFQQLWCGWRWHESVDARAVGWFCENARFLKEGRF